MPELPEVETTRRGIEPHVVGRLVRAVVVRRADLRWPVPRSLARTLPGQRFLAAERRAKYLLLRAQRGTAILHLGMSGSLRVVPAAAQASPHDHVDLVLDDGRALRLRDPRRFGALLWTRDDPLRHPLLRDLGPEPLSPAFSGAVLHARSRGRSAAVKAFLMDAAVVVGVGNIYASEALHSAGIHPRRPAGRISRERYDALAAAVRAVLQRSIERGGTTLRDFVGGDGEPGWFANELAVYDRAGAPCPRCAQPVRVEWLAQRSTYFCPACQR